MQSPTILTFYQSFFFHQIPVEVRLRSKSTLRTVPLHFLLWNRAQSSTRTHSLKALMMSSRSSLQSGEFDEVQFTPAKHSAKFHHFQCNAFLLINHCASEWFSPCIFSFTWCEFQVLPENSTIGSDTLIGFRINANDTNCAFCESFFSFGPVHPASWNTRSQNIPVNKTNWTLSTFNF